MNSPTFEHDVALISRDELDQLENQLQVQLNGRIRNLHLSIDNGSLVLCGRVHTYYAKQLAQQFLMNTTDLPISANDIDVL